MAINKFLEIQAKDLELKKSELQVRKAEIDNSQIYSLRVLEAQKEDREETRKIYSSMVKFKLISFVISLFIVLVFCVCIVFMGEKELITEILKIAIPSIATGIGGFYFGKNKSVESAKNNQD